MWDSSTPLQLLQSMPKVLENEHLEKLQKLFEADKYKNRIVNGDADLCGQYAPFCNDCDKDSDYPCAVAYVNFMKSQGMDIEIASGDEPTETLVEEPEEVEEITEESATEEVEEVAEETVREEVEEATEETQTNPTPAKKIRIAIARKKTLL